MRRRRGSAWRYLFDVDAVELQEELDELSVGRVEDRRTFCRLNQAGKSQ
jgi:hypothetical protein